MARRSKNFVDLPAALKPFLKDGVLKIPDTTEAKYQLKVYVNSFLDTYENKYKAGKIDTRQIRQALPFKGLFIGPDEKDLTGVGKYFANAKSVGFGKSGKYREHFLRDILTSKSVSPSELAHNYGPKRLAKLGLTKGKFEDHHILFRTLFEPFYEGLKPKEMFELTEHLIQDGFPLGNVLANLEAVDKELHTKLAESIHTWALDNNIQVSPGPKNWTNFVKNRVVLGGALPDEFNQRLLAATTPDEVTKILKEGAELYPQNKWLSKAKMLNWEGVPLKNRLFPASKWGELISDPLKQKLAEIVNQQEVIKEVQGGPKARSIDTILKGWSEKVTDYATRANLVQDWNLDEKAAKFMNEQLDEVFNAWKVNALTKGAANVGGDAFLGTGLGAAFSVAFTPEGQKQWQEKRYGDLLTTAAKGEVISQTGGRAAMALYRKFAPEALKQGARYVGSTAASLLVKPALAAGALVLGTGAFTPVGTADKSGNELWDEDGNPLLPIKQDTPQPSQEPVEEPITSLELDML